MYILISADDSSPEIVSVSYQRLIPYAASVRVVDAQTPTVTFTKSMVYLRFT